MGYTDKLSRSGLTLEWHWVQTHLSFMRRTGNQAQLIGKMGSSSQKAPGSASRAYTVTRWVLGGLPWVQAERLR